MKIRLQLLFLFSAFLSFAQSPVIYKRPVPSYYRLPNGYFQNTNYLVCAYNGNTYSVRNVYTSRQGSLFDSFYVSLIHINNKNIPLDTIKIITEQKAFFINNIFKVIVKQDDVFLFYNIEGYSNDSITVDSMGCITYNFKTKQSKNRRFFISSKFHKGYEDIVLSNNQFVIAYSEDTLLMSNNYYKVFDTAFNLVKTIPIQFNTRYYKSYLINGKNNFIYHFFYYGIGFEYGFDYKLWKLDTSLAIVSSTSAADTSDNLANTWNAADVALNEDSSEVRVTMLTAHVHDFIYADVYAVFKNYDEDLNLVKEGYTNIYKNSTNQIDYTMFRAIRFYNKRYILFLKIDSSSNENYLFSFTNDFQLLKMYPFRTGSNFYVTSIWHTFYFSDEYNSYALPLEETDGIPDAGMKPNINYYPNPARHYVTFYVTDPGEYNVKMYTASGQLLFEKPLTKENTLDIQDLSPGFYYVELLNHGAPVMKNKLVKTD